jgi:hypothetical protein
VVTQNLNKERQQTPKRFVFFILKGAREGGGGVNEFEFEDQHAAAVGHVWARRRRGARTRVIWVSDGPSKSETIPLVEP